MICPKCGNGELQQHHRFCCQGCLENDDLENNDLENDDLLNKTAESGGRLIEVCPIPGQNQNGIFIANLSVILSNVPNTHANRS